MNVSLSRILIGLALLLTGGLVHAENTDRPQAPTSTAAKNAPVFHPMEMDLTGMVMNSNPDRLPRGCQRVSKDLEITVRAGRKYARQFNGKMFAYDTREWKVPPCSRLKITFINEDHIRHQFMIHGLPPDLYPPIGMFHIEVTGPGQKTGTLILPNADKTYLVHCEVAQHMEKGMKAQIKVGNSEENLSSIPGLSEPVRPDSYPVQWTSSSFITLTVGALLGLMAAIVSPIVLARMKQSSH